MASISGYERNVLVLQVESTAVERKIQTLAAKNVSTIAQAELSQLNKDIEVLKAEGALTKRQIDNLTLQMPSRGDLAKLNNLALKLLLINRDCELHGIGLEKIAEKIGIGSYKSMSDKLDAVARLYSSTSSALATEYAKIRAEVPRPADPLLDTIIATDSQIAANAMTGKVIENARVLQSGGAQPQNVTIQRVGAVTEQHEVWTDAPDTRHFGMDHADWKLPRLAENLDPAKGTQGLEWMTSALKLKTCASVLKNTDPTFCGQKGMLVYLAPKSPEAVIAIEPHDASSPSEIWDFSKPLYGVALCTVHEYLMDQKKFRVTFDFATQIKSSIETELEGKYKTDPRYKIVRDLLDRKFPTSFEKKYYEQVQPTNLELELGGIVEMLKQLPELASDVGCTFIAIRRLQSKVEAYLAKPEVNERGVQRLQTTEWQVDPEDKTHILAARQRTKGATIAAISTALTKTSNIFVGDYAVVGDTIDEKSALAFATGATTKELFFRNIFRNTIQSYTLTQAIEIFEKIVRDPDRARLAKEMKRESKAVAMQTGQMPPGKKASRLPTQANIDLLKKMSAQEIKDVGEKCVTLANELKELKQLAKYSYTEIQLYSSECLICGIGVKQQILDQLKTLGVQHFEDELKVKEAVYQQANQAYQKELQACGGNYKDPALVPFMNALNTAKDTMDEISGIVNTHKIMMHAQVLGIPCYIHKG